MKNKFLVSVFLLLLILQTSFFSQQISQEAILKIKAIATIRSCYSPSFSPNGHQVVFICDLTGSPQIWKMPTKGGFPTQITDFKNPVTFVEWSPKENKIAFQIAPGGGEKSQIFLMDSDGTNIKQISLGNKTTNWFSGWSPDGKYFSYSSNPSNPAQMDSFLYSLDSGRSKLIAKNKKRGWISSIDIKRNLFLVNRNEFRGNNNIYLVDEKGNETLLTPHKVPSSFKAKFSPNGNIYFASNFNRDLIAFSKLENGKIKILSERSDAELENFFINHAGSQALLFWNVRGKNEISIFDLQQEKTLKTLAPPVELFYEGRFSQNNQYFVFGATGSTQPWNIWLLNVKNGVFKKLTESPHPGVKLTSLASPKFVTFKSFDGLELSGLLYIPNNKEKKPYPTVIDFHGGPEWQARPDMDYTFQALLSEGIAVFAPNVRGSTGFGKRFLNLDNGALRLNAIKDIKASYDFLINEGIANPKKVGIMGGSYGGYMTMAGITEYPNMFAAAANLFGVVNFITFFENTEPWMAAISKVEYGDPKTEIEMLKRLSPINRVNRIKIPTLVLHGANDTNVPVNEANQIVQKLKERNIPVKYVLFPDEGHGWRKLDNKIESTVSIVNWFKTYLSNK